MTRGFWRGWRGLLVVALAAFAFGQWLRTSGPDIRDIGAHPALADILADREAPEEGPTDADVTLIVFTDYRCPLCRADAPALEAAVRRDGHVRVSYRDWPVLGPTSLAGARVALAAARQGRYGPVHRALMAADTLDEAGLRRAADEAGVDRATIVATQIAPEIEARLIRTNQQALALALPGTPAYVAGRYLAVGRQGERGFARLIARARNAR